MVFFEDGSPNKDIHQALCDAERVRKAIREAETVKAASRAQSAEQTDGGDKLSAFARRGISRRSVSPGRVR